MDRAELQAVQLALALGLGVGLGFFYDVYRVWFRQLRGRLWPAVGDIAWWLAALALAFGGLYRINGAELRLPVLALTAGGVCLYMWVISPLLFRLLCRVLLGLWRLAVWLGGCFAGALSLLLSPLVWLVEIFFRLLRLAARLLAWGYRVLAGLFGWLCAPGRRLAAALKRAAKNLAEKNQKNPAKKVDFDVPDDI